VSGSPFLRLERVARRWPSVVALDGVDLCVERGERVALIGPSGSGKSTLLALVAGSLAPTEGDIVVDGERVQELSGDHLRRHRARCGIVPQGSVLSGQLSVHQNVVSGLLPRWSWHRVALSAIWPLERKRVHEALEAVDMADRQWELAENLSGGEQQRVAVARALIAKPSILLADEPTASIDPHRAKSVVDALVRHARRNGATLLLSTHHVRLVTDSVDRLVGLRDGRVVIDAAPSEVSENALESLYAGSNERQ